MKTLFWFARDREADASAQAEKIEGGVSLRALKYWDGSAEPCDRVLVHDCAEAEAVEKAYARADAKGDTETKVERIALPQPAKAAKAPATKAAATKATKATKAAATKAAE